MASTDNALVVNIDDFITFLGSILKDHLTKINGNAADLTGLSTDIKTNLVAAINEVYSLAKSAASSGGAVIDDTTSRTSTTYSSSKSTSVAQGLATTAANSAVAALLSDAATDTTHTWSASKINSVVQAAVQAGVTSVLGVNPDSAYDTLKEISDYIAGDKSGATAMAASIANKVAFDQAQSLTAAQKAQALSNIGGISAAAIGDTGTDFVALLRARL